LEADLWHWFAFGALVVVLLALDLVVFHRWVHAATMVGSAGWSLFWITLAFVEGLVRWWGRTTHGDSGAGLTFLNGFLVGN